MILGFLIHEVLSLFPEVYKGSVNSWNYFQIEGFTFFFLIVMPYISVSSLTTTLIIMLNRSDKQDHSSLVNSFSRECSIFLPLSMMLATLLLLLLF